MMTWLRVGRKDVEIRSDEAIPFRVAFFNTFMAYNVPLSGAVIFLTRNTCNDQNLRW